MRSNDMENRLPSRVAVRRLLFGILWMPIVAFAHSTGDVEQRLQEEERYAQLVDQPAPPFELVDTEGRSWSLDQLDGKTLVLNFIYARCTDICPAHMALIAELQQMVNAAKMQEQVLFVTIATDTEDPATTAEVMNTYQDRFKLDPVNWVFLYGGAEAPEAGIQLAERYGLKFTQTDEGTQMHGVVTHLIDREGRMRARFHGLGFQPINMVSYANTLVYDFHPSTAEAATPSADSAKLTLPILIGGGLASGGLFAGVFGLLYVRRRGKR